MYSSIITPKVANGWVSHQTNLGVESYDLDESYSPDTELWKSKVLDLASPKYEPNKTYAFDRSRYRNHGTITGASWVRLPNGLWVLDFDGDDYVTVIDATSLRNFADFSMGIWFKTSKDYSGGQGHLITKYTSAGDAYYDLLMRTNNKLGFDYRDNDATEPSGLSSLAVVNDGKWHRAMTSRDTVAPYRGLWLDGVLQASGTIGIGTASMSEADRNIRIGARSYSTAAEFFTGQLALASISNLPKSNENAISYFNQTWYLFGV